MGFFIYDGAFFTLVKPYFKNVLNSIELPLGSIFYAPNPFVKKLSTLKTSRETEKKSFFSKFDYTMEWSHHIASVKIVKTACVCVVFFFHYFKYYGRLIARVERKE